MVRVFEVLSFGRKLLPADSTDSGPVLPFEIPLSDEGVMLLLFWIIFARGNNCIVNKPNTL